MPLFGQKNIDGTNYGISAGRKNIKPLIKLFNRNYTSPQSGKEKRTKYRKYLAVFFRG